MRPTHPEKSNRLHLATDSIASLNQNVPPSHIQKMSDQISGYPESIRLILRIHITVPLAASLALKPLVTRHSCCTLTTLCASAALVARGPHRSRASHASLEHPISPLPIPSKARTTLSGRWLSGTRARNCGPPWATALFYLKGPKSCHRSLYFLPLSGRS